MREEVKSTPADRWGTMFPLNTRMSLLARQETLVRGHLILGDLGASHHVTDLVFGQTVLTAVLRPDLDLVEGIVVAHSSLLGRGKEEEV